ncbi:uncharacterized protein LOC144882505 isoform X1 [Branchiostoma floridae x Branchiostoma japonicum]
MKSRSFWTVLLMKLIKTIIHHILTPPGNLRMNCTTEQRDQVGAKGSPAGPRGYRGYSGSKGQKGDRGLTGPSIQGQKGDRGLTGYRGYPGSKGQKGDRGLTGTSIQGPKGDRGYSGSKGQKGDRGLTGTSIQGPKGDRGPVGPKGDHGSAGSKGQKGAIGLTGPSPQTYIRRCEVGKVDSGSGGEHILHSTARAWRQVCKHYHFRSPFHVAPIVHLSSILEDSFAGGHRIELTVKRRTERYVEVCMATWWDSRWHQVIVSILACA